VICDAAKQAKNCCHQLVNIPKGQRWHAIWCRAEGLVGGMVVWLAEHAHLSCLDLRQCITIGVDIYSCIHAVVNGASQYAHAFYAP
jgi:hypothetical protein